MRDSTSASAIQRIAHLIGPMTIPLVTFGAGCQVIAPVASLSVEDRAAGSNQSAVAQANLPSVAVEIYPEGRRPSRAKVPLTGPLTVQQALQKTKATSRFGKAKISVIRTVDQRGKKAKMGVEYHSKSGRVAPTSDYALYPGDRIMVKEDTSLPMTDFLGPLTRVVGKR